MNLILTDKCTNSCPYCFAAQEMSKNLRQNNMKREDFDCFMNFLRNSKEKIEINVIGGEPLIYPDIEYVLNCLNQSSYIKNICVMTGGIVKKDIFNLLLKYKKKMLIMFNVNEKTCYLTKTHHEIVRNNLKYAISLGHKVCLGFNIFHQNFHYQEILDLCTTLGITNLRFAIACPIYGSDKNDIVPAIEYKILSKRVFAFLKKCFELGIEANLDCPVPMCFFTDKQLGSISKMHPQIINKLGKCSTPIDINYNLKLLRCFSIGSYHNKCLSEFKSFGEIHQYFTNEIDSRLSHPYVFSECEKCFFAKKCNGGCLSNNPGFIEQPNKFERISEVLRLANNDNESEAIELLEQEKDLQDIDLFLLAKLYYNIGDLKKAHYYCCNAIHESDSLKLSRDASRFLKLINKKSS